MHIGSVVELALNRSGTPVEDIDPSAVSAIQKLAYPVMTPPTGRARACTLDCAGAQAAYKRARQQHSIAKKAGFPTDAAYHNRMAKKAHALGKKFGCKWAARAFGPTK